MGYSFSLYAFIYSISALIFLLVCDGTDGSGCLAGMYTVIYFIIGIVRFVFLMIEANDYGNQYNESDPETAKYGG